MRWENNEFTQKSCSFNSEHLNDIFVEMGCRKYFTLDLPFSINSLFITAPYLESMTDAIR